MIASPNRLLPPTEVAFAHRPTDAEAAVWFAPRVVNGHVDMHERDGRTYWEISLAAQRIVFGFCTLIVGAVLGIAYFSTRPEPGAVGYVVCVGTLAFFFGSWFVWWYNREARALNPLLVFDPERRTLMITGRAEPIATDDVVEILYWFLSRTQKISLGLYDGQGEEMDEPAQVTALCTDGAGFRIVYLYHTTSGDHRHWPWYRSRSRTLAEKLGVPFRVIAADAMPHDQRPLKSFEKRPKPVTRK
jgi:hypothetical protein